ncbi:MAG: hypothetical protein M5U34_35610 [Chloroflexi bacterium]|nr:hypothetical protein [Chloroflexota bacterium]
MRILVTGGSGFIGRVSRPPSACFDRLSTPRLRQVQRPLRCSCASHSAPSPYPLPFPV